MFQQVCADWNNLVEHTGKIQKTKGSCTESKSLIRQWDIKSSRKGKDRGKEASPRIIGENSAPAACGLVNLVAVVVRSFCSDCFWTS